tara:strand:- start:365 stop:859 length:495 start_codon:yes stop_codon:yes gene_type:complete
MAIQIVASLAECIFTITKVEEYVPWIKDEIMPKVLHVVGRIESDKLGENGSPLYTQIGFFIHMEKKEAFEAKLNQRVTLPQSPLRPLIYNTGKGHRNVQVEPTSKATIEIMYDGKDPLAGLDYYFDPKNRLGNRGGWAIAPPASNAHAGNTEVGADEIAETIDW